MKNKESDKVFVVKQNDTLKESFSFIPFVFQYLMK